ncbi:hypothetical protein P691DRAFT_804792 [Macrolepiota fuliginosa MF-IS2]|uniref:Nephrocystin 3-like N-terminal domain-containing protein n=1 Tax=Macrolepiota fuliginosa MF-IS2 TaxID=1400762 RepID=A0A9P6BZA7_9AGAR|nr:hypothetical protein P691DRAFT_804792 [Macrolepiota fuliginosa MF-IS2]
MIEFQRSLGGASGDAMELSLVMLLANVLPDVELDSPARFPLSRCHRGTRRYFRNRVTAWLINSHREEHILWITGPAGVGKSTVAQSIAEHCHQTGRLGAALFFSRAGQSDDVAERVIPTLACQLALRFPDYKALLAAALVDNPGVTEKDLHAQFLELIARPLKKLQRRRLLFSAQNPLVIVLDTLDACGGKAVQTDLVNIITAFTQEFLAIGLLWIFCCRPEPRLRKSLWRTDALGLSRHEVLSMDDVEARDDVEIILRDGLHDIRKQYLYRFGPSEIWPTPVHWWRLMKATSGFYMFASGILEYVGDEHQMDPRALLELCLEFIENSLVPHTLHPFHTLDSLYGQIVLSINPDSLPLTTRILGLCVYHSSDGLTVPDIMNLLGIDQRTLNNALDGLHSVIHVPAPGADDEARIRFYHPSFPDFLKDPNRSGQIAQRILAYKEDPYCHHLQQPTSGASASGSRANIAGPSTRVAEPSLGIDDRLSIGGDPFQGGEPATPLQLQLARGSSSRASFSSSSLEALITPDPSGVQTTSRKGTELSW